LGRVVPTALFLRLCLNYKNLHTIFSSFIVHQINAKVTTKYAPIL